MSSPSNCVMIINDNADLVNLFQDALEHQGIETCTSTNPNLALSNINANPNQFSLVLIDYASQSIGSERRFAREVKAIKRNIKVMLTSGYNLSATDISNDGYDNFLQLPVKLSTLVSNVKEMLATS